LSVHLSVCLFCIVLCFTVFSVFNCLHFFANKERERERERERDIHKTVKILSVCLTAAAGAIFNLRLTNILTN